MARTRLHDVAQEFLRWQAEQGRRESDPVRFLLLGAETADGVLIATEELESATEHLHAVGLIAGPKLRDRPMPTRISLTADGIRCLNDFDGDVWAWSQRDNPYVDQSITVHAARDAQVVAHSRYVTQTRSVENANPIE